jgi:hypothetical protein
VLKSEIRERTKCPDNLDICNSKKRLHPHPR